MSDIRRAVQLPCPDESVWAEVAAGVISGPEGERLLLHASECSSCAAALRWTIHAIGADEQIEETVGEDNTAPATDLTALARRMGALHRRRRRYLYVYAAAGIAVLLLAPAAVWWWRTRSAPPLDSLAAAYTAKRMVELRISGAGYGPMRVQRGAADGAPAALLESKARIRHYSGHHPADPGWLHASGRAALLEWRPDEAVQSFQAARQLGSSSAPFWIDFATAWFERAELSGASDDYCHALEYLNNALAADPRNAAALFNRGIVHARLHRREDAIGDFEASLRLEPNGSWAAETRQRLEDLRRHDRGATPTNPFPAEFSPGCAADRR